MDKIARMYRAVPESIVLLASFASSAGAGSLFLAVIETAGFHGYWQAMAAIAVAAAVFWISRKRARAADSHEIMVAMALSWLTLAISVLVLLL